LESAQKTPRLGGLTLRSLVGPGPQRPGIPLQPTPLSGGVTLRSLVGVGLQRPGNSPPPIPLSGGVTLRSLVGVGLQQPGNSPPTSIARIARPATKRESNSPHVLATHTSKKANSPLGRGDLAKLGWGGSAATRQLAPHRHCEDHPSR
jgi:hypothetical protein